MVYDLRAVARLIQGRTPQPTAAMLDSRTTLRSAPESGYRSGYDGAKPKKGSKVHAAASTLWEHLLALRVTPATEQDRTQVEQLVRSVQEEATGQSVELEGVDRGYTGSIPLPRHRPKAASGLR